ncbi:hypothetical protein ES703_114736 [subsurface metagenome]
MGLLNYSTRIPAAQTAGEVQGILGKNGAKAVMIEYGDGGNAEALSFQIKRGEDSLGFRLPIAPDRVLKVLQNQYDSGKLRSHQGRPDREQSVKVAWRILKDWVEAQMAYLETEQVTIEQLFLSYMLTRDNKTLYQAMLDRGFYLPEGRGEAK